jgi:hypothetical protein
MVNFDGFGCGHSGEGQPKAGEPEVVREAVLMGEHRIMRLPLYAAAPTRLRGA